MIISYSNNFVVVRPPKTGSTSLVYYFFKSGLIDREKDTYYIGSNFYTWEQAEAWENNKEKNILPSSPTAAKFIIRPKGGVHRTFSDMYARGAVKPDMPCVASIRNPLKRMSSLYYYRKNYPGPKPAYLADPNVFWDHVKVNELAQCDYFPKHAELFNTEHLHEHVSKYILEKGGRVEQPIRKNNNPDNKSDAFLAELTPDRKQDILDTYAKDFELWEKAYAVYN